jgi:hypothetical protein
LSRNPSLKTFLVLVVFSCAPHLFAAAKLSSISVGPGTITGGATSTVCTATLTAAAPNKGASISVTSSNPSVISPVTINIPAGQTSAAVQLTTFAVQSNTTVTMTGSYGGSSATSSVNVLTPVLSIVVCNPNPVMAQAGVETISVQLNANAPSGGSVVSLTSSSPAVPVPSTVTIPAGASSTQFTVTPSQVSVSTTVQITASVYGSTASGSFVVEPCTPASPSIPAASPLDHVWIDDAAPAGAVQSGSGGWDSGVAASGTSSCTTFLAAGAHEVTFTGAADQRVIGAGENLVAYVLAARCAPPREIVVGWHTTAGAWKKAYYGAQLLGGEAGMVSLGAIPSSQSWQRVVIASSQLGLGGATVDGFTLQAYDGQAWADHAAAICSEALVAPPSLPSSDHYWIDDALPSGGTLTGSAAFDGAQHATGAKALVSTLAVQPNGNAAISISSSGAMLPVESGQTLLLYALADACSSPSEILVTWYDTAGNARSAFWGTPHGLAGETSSRGAMPSATDWSRLELPAAALGLEGHTINRVDLTSAGGVVWFDAIGTGGSTCTLPAQPQPSIPAGDAVWIDDSGDVFAGDGGLTWDTTQSASGTQSLRIVTTNPASQTDFAFALPAPVTIASGDQFIVYVLIDPCAPPVRFGFTWSASAAGQVYGAYWGDAYPSWDATTWWHRMGPLPAAAGSWVRLAIPAAALANLTVDVSNTFQYGGRMWFDHYGRSGSSCVVSTQPPPAIPPGDAIWIDDSGDVFAGDGGLTWDATQAASGTRSLRIVTTSPSTQTDFAFALPSPSTMAGSDQLVSYVLIDPCAPPVRFGITWSASAAGVVYGAYWGDANPAWDATPWWHRIGPLPAAGSWARLSVPATVLSGLTVDVSNTYQFGGKMWFDHYGKASQ